jgi:hypothetical protein
MWKSSIRHFRYGHEHIAAATTDYGVVAGWRMSQR